jgi:hypothetical protein
LSSVSGCCVTYRRVLDGLIGFTDPLHTQLGLQAVQRYRYSTHFQFTVTHALGFSVFTSRILATDLSQSPCHFKSHMKSSHSLIPFLPPQFNSSAPKLISRQAGVSKLDSVLLSLSLSLMLRSTVSRSVSLGIKHPFGAYDQIFITCVTVTVLFLWGALSDERTDLSFIHAAGPCQRNLSLVRVPWDSRTYFTVSDLRPPFSSPPTTRRVTVESAPQNKTVLSILLN